MIPGKGQKTLSVIKDRTLEFAHLVRLFWKLVEASVAQNIQTTVRKIRFSDYVEEKEEGFKGYLRRLVR